MHRQYTFTEPKTIHEELLIHYISPHVEPTHNLLTNYVDYKLPQFLTQKHQPIEQKSGTRIKISFWMQE